MKLKLFCEKQMNFSLFKLFNDCQLISVNTVIEYYKDFEGGWESMYSDDFMDSGWRVKLKYIVFNIIY